MQKVVAEENHKAGESVRQLNATFGLARLKARIGVVKMNKYNLINEFFSNPEDAVKFFVQLKVLKITNEDAFCTASLEKETDNKWTYMLEWEDGKYIGEYRRACKTGGGTQNRCYHRSLR